MTLEQVNEYLHRYTFTQVGTGISYRLIGTTMNVNGVPLTYYEIEEKDDSFYIRHEKPLISTNPLLLRIEEKSFQVRVDLIDQINGKYFCTLIAPK